MTDYDDDDEIKKQFEHIDEFALKRLEGTRIAEKSYNIIHSVKISIDDFWWMYSMFGDLRLYEAMGDKQGNREAQGVETLLDIKKDVGSLTPDSINKFLSNPVNIDKLKLRFFLAWHKRMDRNEFDPITKSAILAYSKRNFLPFYFFSDKFWLQWVFEGSTGVITGNKGSGKTDFGLLLCEIARRNGYGVVSNVRVEHEEYEKGYFTAFSEMLEKVINNALQSKKTLIFTDEMTVSGMRKKQAMRGTSLNLEQFEKLTRKFYATTMYIWHMDTEIPTEIFRSMNFEGHKNGSEGDKVGRTTGVFKFNYGSSWNTYIIKGIPSAGLNYDTRDLAPFILDIKLEELIKVARTAEEEIKNNNDLLRAIRDYIVEQRSKNERE